MLIFTVIRTWYLLLSNNILALYFNVLIGVHYVNLLFCALGTVQINLFKLLIISIYWCLFSVPEELEIDESDSLDSGVTSSSAKDAALARKAYSSPVQRTRSVDTELCQLPSAMEGTALETQPSHCTDADSGINIGVTKAANLMLSRTNEEIAKSGLNTATVAVNNPYGRHIVNSGFSEDVKNQQIIHEKSVQKCPSYTVIGKEDNLLQSFQRNPGALKSPLQHGPDFDACIEDSTHGCIRVSRAKSKNSFAPNEGESNKVIAQKEHSSQDPQVEGSAFGPALKNNENSHDKSASNSQVQKEKDINLNIIETSTSSSVKKDSKQMSKHDTHLNQNSVMVNPVVSDNMVSSSRSELDVELVSVPKLQNLPVTQQTPFKDVVISVTSTTEMKAQNMQAEKCNSTRKKPKSEYNDVISAAEEKWSYIQSILSVLNSLAGKGKSVPGFVLNSH